MRCLQAIILMAWFCAVHTSAGTMSSAGSGFGSGTALRDVFQIWGDTQQFSRDLEAYDAGGALTSFQALATWACAQRANPLNDGRSRLRGVLQMGAIVDNAGIAAQWTIYGQARDILENCATGPVPAVPTQGNHDVDPIVQSHDVYSDATAYHQNAGKDQIDGQPWFGGRGTAQEISTGLIGAEDEAPAGVTYYLEAPSYGSRSFWINFTNRLKVFSAEYDLGARAAANWAPSVLFAMSGFEVISTLSRQPANSPALWIFISHSGPCSVTIFAGTPCYAVELEGNYNWDAIVDALPNNVAVFLGGHWNGSSPSNGQGQFTTAITRDTGGQALAGIMDFSSIVPCDDITAGACASSNPYTWQGMLILDRTKNTICIRTARYIDIDSDNNGTVNVPAAGATSLAAAATTYNRTQPAGAPNDAETCITVPAL